MLHQLTLGYGESGLEISGRDFSSTSALATELICGVGSGADSASGGALFTSGIDSDF